MKGSRLDAVRKIINILRSWDLEERLSTLWQYFPEEEHLYFVEDAPNGVRQYQVCGKILQDTQKVGYTLAERYTKGE